MTPEAIGDPEWLPLFIARVSGVAFDHMSCLATAELTKALEQYLANQRDVQHRREAVAQVLYDVVGRSHASPHRNLLLRFRRDLYNARVPRPSDVSVALQMLGEPARRDVTTFVELLERVAKESQELGRLYGVALEETRCALKSLLGQAAFQRGLMLSSWTLYVNLSRYLDSDVSAMSSRVEQIERGLLKYLTRAATKATPFGTFCTVVSGQMARGSHKSDAILTIEPSTYEQSSNVHLNRKLLGVLWGHLKARPRVRSRLRARLNPFTTREPRHWVFLASVEGRELVQRMPSNEALDFVCQWMLQCESETLENLARQLSDEPRIAATTEEAFEYVSTLQQRGLLVFQAIAPERDANWAAALREALRDCDDEHARLVVQLLLDLESMLVSFASAEIEQRWRWFAEMRSKINVTCETLGVSTAQLRDLPVYEDAGADAAMTLRLTPSISAALDDLAELIVRTQPLAYPQPRQATMREFFERTYPDRSSVPLLEFYETFYREHYKEFRERELDVMQQRLPDGDLFNPLKLDSVEQIRSVQRAILGLFRDAWSVSPEAVEVDVSRQQLVRVLEPLRRPSEAEFSVSVFCQGVASRCCEEDSVRLVVPNAQYTLGYGKYFSRFLPLVHEGLTTLVRETNRAMGSATLAEITADGNFNGNYHPQLVEHDIHYPTTESLAQGTIRCDQLVVERHDAESQLRLRETKSGEPVIPLDLGFLTQMQRPPLFQLLTWFNTSGTLSLPLPETLAKPAQGDGVSEDGGDPKPIEYRPRITYNGTVVVARRRWAIPSVLFPKPYPDERDHEYFIRLNSWREQHTIPSQVFAKVLASERPGSKPNEAESAEPLPQRNEEETPSVPARPRVRRSQDFRKPQFIDFESPLLVKLFPKLPADLEKFTVVLEERYPTADDLPHTAMGRHACELVLQLSRSWRGDPTCMRQTCAGQVDFAGVSNEAPKASMLTTS